MLTTTDGLTDTRRLIHQGWEQVAVEYAKDRAGIFGKYAGRLLNLLHPPAESTLLDVGAGSGAVALQAAPWVGPEGLVIGSDIATAMVSQAKQTAEEQGAANVTFCQMDAEQLGFPDAFFNVVTCAFSLFQFPNMDQALAEMQRVLKPGGRLGLSNWGPGYFSPIASLQRSLFREFGLKALLPNPIAFKPTKLESMLAEAGFTTIELLEETDDVWVESPGEIWAFNMDMGPFPVMLQRQLSAAQRMELTRRFEAMLENLVTEQGIRCTFHPLYALAEKGGAG